MLTLRHGSVASGEFVPAACVFLWLCFKCVQYKVVGGGAIAPRLGVYGLLCQSFGALINNVVVQVGVRLLIFQRVSLELTGRSSVKQSQK